jgi:hypothetical protein
MEVLGRHDEEIELANGPVRGAVIDTRREGNV